jgi:5-methyltetrahydropteroyltriglutamate--homocysteine methyltransferase
MACNHNVCQNIFESWNYPYLYAIADAMREEYQRIVEVGFLLQIDDPPLVIYYGANLGLSLAPCLEWAELQVEGLNSALRDIPPEKVRYHICYGIDIGPRVHEVSLGCGSPIAQNQCWRLFL